MRDFPYCVTPAALWLGAGHIACRNAVLWPLVKASPMPSILRAYAKLQQIWRDRIWALAANGWRAASGPDNSTKTLNITYLRNCPPFGAATTVRKGRPCNRLRVCPMCYARQVVLEAYKALEFALYGFSAKPILRDTWVVAINRSRRVDLAREELSQLLTNPKDANGESERWKDAERSSARLGAITVVTVAPSEAEEYCTLSHATLLLSLRPVYSWAGVKLRTIAPDKITRKSLAALVSLALPYPTGMMFGNAKTAVAIANLSAELKTKAAVIKTIGYLQNHELRKKKGTTE